MSNHCFLCWTNFLLSLQMLFLFHLSRGILKLVTLCGNDENILNRFFRKNVCALVVFPKH